MVWRLFPERFGDEGSFLRRLRRLADAARSVLTLDEPPDGETDRDLEPREAQTEVSGCSSNADVSHRRSLENVGGYLRGGGILMSRMAVVVLYNHKTLASLQCRDGTSRVFTDQADIVCTKAEAS